MRNDWTEEECLDRGLDRGMLVVVSWLISLHRGAPEVYNKLHIISDLHVSKKEWSVV